MKIICELNNLGLTPALTAHPTLLWGLTPALTAHPTLLRGLTPATTLNSSNHPQTRIRFSITALDGIFPSAVTYFVLHNSPSVK